MAGNIDDDIAMGVLDFLCQKLMLSVYRGYGEVNDEGKQDEKYMCYTTHGDWHEHGVEWEKAIAKMMETCDQVTADGPKRDVWMAGKSEWVTIKNRLLTSKFALKRKTTGWKHLDKHLEDIETELPALAKVIE